MQKFRVASRFIAFYTIIGICESVQLWAPTVSLENTCADFEYKKLYLCLLCRHACSVTLPDVYQRLSGNSANRITFPLALVKPSRWCGSMQHSHITTGEKRKPALPRLPGSHVIRRRVKRSDRPTLSCRGETWEDLHHFTFLQIRWICERAIKSEFSPIL